MPSIMRSGVAAAAAVIFTVGALGDSYEPSYPWLMPLSVAALGAGIGRWWVLWVALLPVLFAIPEESGDDSPAILLALGMAMLGAFLLAVGVTATKVVEHALASRAAETKS